MERETASQYNRDQEIQVAANSPHHRHVFWRSLDDELDHDRDDQIESETGENDEQEHTGDTPSTLMGVSFGQSPGLEKLPDLLKRVRQADGDRDVKRDLQRNQERGSDGGDDHLPPAGNWFSNGLTKNPCSSLAKGRIATKGGGMAAMMRMNRVLSL